MLNHANKPEYRKLVPEHCLQANASLTNTTSKRKIQVLKQESGTL